MALSFIHPTFAVRSHLITILSNCVKMRSNINQPIKYEYAWIYYREEETNDRWTKLTFYFRFVLRIVLFLNRSFSVCLGLFSCDEIYKNKTVPIKSNAWNFWAAKAKWLNATPSPATATKHFYKFTKYSALCLCVANMFGFEKDVQTSAIRVCVCARTKYIYFIKEEKNRKLCIKTKIFHRPLFHMHCN